MYLVILLYVSENVYKQSVSFKTIKYSSFTSKFLQKAYWTRDFTAFLLNLKWPFLPLAVWEWMMNQVVPESPSGIVSCKGRGEIRKLLELRQYQLNCKSGRGKSVSSFFYFLFFKTPPSNPRLESQAMWAVCISMFKDSTMPMILAEICRRGWTDKTTQN